MKHCMVPYAVLVWGLVDCLSSLFLLPDGCFSPPTWTAGMLPLVIQNYEMDFELLIAWPQHLGFINGWGRV